MKPYNAIARAGHAWRILAWSPALALSAGAATYYVSTSGSNTPPYGSWETAANDIQDAVNQAANGDTVLVARGTYRPAVTVDVLKGIALRGIDGAAATTIDAGGVTRGLKVNHAGARVEGFTLAQGSFYGPGGGVYIGAGTVAACVIVSNISKSFVSETSFTTGYGGGAYVEPEGRLEGCIVAFNSALAYDNIDFVPGLGGGVYVNRGILHSCTVVSNRADTSGGGVFFEGPGAAAENSILYFNRQLSQEDNYSHSGGDPGFTNCCVNESLAFLKGTNNINANPNFVSNTGDFHLRAASPCIDAGVNRAWMGSARDLDGHPRVYNGRTDIGADEAAFQAWGMMTDSSGVWTKWDVVVGAPRQFEWSTNLSAGAWIPLGSTVTGTAMKIMILDFQPPQARRAYRMRWIRP